MSQKEKKKWVNWVLLLAITLSLISSCGKSSQETSPPATLPLMATGPLTSTFTSTQKLLTFRYPDNVLFPEDFSQNDVNVYRGGKSINFIRDDIEVFFEVFGAPQEIRANGGDGKDKMLEALYSDARVSVSYYEKQKRITSIIINNSEYNVERGGKVGDTKEAILAKYPGGYMTEGSYIGFPGQLYCFLVPDSDDPVVARGYDFYFGDSEVLQAIYVSSETFAP